MIDHKGRRLPKQLPRGWRNMTYTEYYNDNEYEYRGYLFVYNENNGHFQYFRFISGDLTSKQFNDRIEALQDTWEPTNLGPRGKSDSDTIRAAAATKAREQKDGKDLTPDGRNIYDNDGYPLLRRGGEIDHQYTDQSEHITLKNVDGDGNCGYWAFMAAMDDAKFPFNPSFKDFIANAKPGSTTVVAPPDLPGVNTQEGVQIILESTLITQGGGPTPASRIYEKVARKHGYTRDECDAVFNILEAAGRIFVWFEEGTKRKLIEQTM